MIRKRYNLILFGILLLFEKCSSETNSKHRMKPNKLTLPWKVEEYNYFFHDCEDWRIGHRKLFSYSDEIVHKSENNGQLHHNIGIVSGHSILQELQKSNEIQTESWDGWGSWSSCSVTCGDGRQVRWRHCSGTNCSKGLKKAQIRKCRLDQCKSKNILNWLGIKTS